MPKLETTIAIADADGVATIIAAQENIGNRMIRGIGETTHALRIGTSERTRDHARGIGDLPSAEILVMTIRGDRTTSDTVDERTTIATEVEISKTHTNPRFKREGRSASWGGNKRTATGAPRCLRNQYTQKLKFTKNPVFAANNSACNLVDTGCEVNLMKEIILNKNATMDKNVIYNLALPPLLHSTWLSLLEHTHHPIAYVPLEMTSTHRMKSFILNHLIRCENPPVSALQPVA